ncbi:hypothetical protein MMC25_006774 [Agyrium rufum]|nr:hypothetical protein [Agyrium rufum]
MSNAAVNNAQSGRADHDNTNGDADANEHTSLLAHVWPSNVGSHFSSSDGTPLYKDSRPYVRFPAAVAHTTWEVLKSNYVNVLLVFVPLGIIAGAMGWDPSAVFILNFLAIIPLAALLSFATEELSVKLGQTLGGLLNATFGNAVELIVSFFNPSGAFAIAKTACVSPGFSISEGVLVSIVALRAGEIRIVQSSMLGSILSNILLVLGCCFLAGGLKKKEQTFNSTVASTMSSLMAVASASLIIPATLYAVMKQQGSTGEKESEDNVLVLSHGTAIILLILYVLYLIFQLKTHADMFDEAPNENEDGGENGGQSEPAEPEILSPWAAAAALVVVTIAVAGCAEYLVNSIDSIVQTAHISKTFIGLVLLPIVGNAAEHVTAVVVSLKSKMDLAIGVAIGSSMQIALLVTPFLVILGWIIGQPMTLHFETFETIVFFLSVLIVNYLIQDGKSNYLEGAMLIGIYVIIALAFFVYPDKPDSV